MDSCIPKEEEEEEEIYADISNNTFQYSIVNVWIYTMCQYTIADVSHCHIHHVYNMSQFLFK
jgi:hypothetical protein